MADQCTYRVEVTDEVATGSDRDTIGGAPQLPIDVEHPRCKVCHEPMLLFWQFDVREEFGLPFKPGSHFLAFMCPKHNDASSAPDPFVKSPLPARYWEQDTGHYAVLLVPPTTSLRIGKLDRHLVGKKIGFVKTAEIIDSTGDFNFGNHEFKVGGTPGWINYAPIPTCACGGTMRFVGQIPESYGFAKRADALEQPNSFSRTEYCYLLGNQVFFLACDRQCDPRAVIAICDN